jgi:hypothetical protein
MKIAIDLNDVLRDYSNNFLRYYCEGYDHTFNPDGLEFWTNDMQLLFEFKNDASYNRCVYEDFSCELCGKCDTCGRSVTKDFSVWMDEIKDIDTDEPIEVMIVSTKEFGQSIGYSLFFISKLGPKVREFYFPVNSMDIWDRCDVLITANPELIDNKPEGKKVIKIRTEYNTENKADYDYRDISQFMSEINNTEKLLD